jgi:DNA-binding response OmpR family regulator
MTPSSTRILLVDDEQSIQTLLSYPLQKEGYEVVSAHDGEQALQCASEQEFDLIVLDVMLPKLDGFEVCRELRARSSVPIIMLTAKDEEFDTVLGLELGADDYITKPFSVREFRSRIKAVMRRADRRDAARREAGEERALDVDGIRIDFARRVVEAAGRAVKLTYVEFEVLAVLARSPGRVFSRQMLLERIWGDAAFRDPRTIDVHIRHLREKLERDPRDPELLMTDRGFGYHLSER